MIDPKIIMKIEDIILQVVDEAEELTRSDLQGRAGAEAMNIYRLVQAHLGK